jgi:hypothetical protein
VRSVFSKLKKLSMAELSQTSPARLMLHVMPCSLSSCWKCSLVEALLAHPDVASFVAWVKTKPDDFMERTRKSQRIRMM